MGSSGSAVMSKSSGEEGDTEVRNAQGIKIGGARAWLQVLGGCLVFFNIWYVYFR